MSKSIANSALALTLLLAFAAQSFGQANQAAAKEQENKLITILMSDAPRKEKADACRQLALVGTKDSVTTLAALLSNEELSHMARYALETILDPAVDDAFRDALNTLKGRPLVGVIGSVGIRRDAKAVEPLAKFLRNDDAVVAQAAARALGRIGTAAAAKALDSALTNVSEANRLAFCEGLFRCAEALAARGQRDEAIAVYARLRTLPAPHQVRTGAVRGEILAHPSEGLTLLRKHLGNQDYALFAAAVRTTHEMPGAEVTQAVAASLSQMPQDHQILGIMTLGFRKDAAALPALFAFAQSGAKPVRLAAIRALPGIGHMSMVPVLVKLMNDADREISQLAQESLASLSGQEADAAVLTMLASDQADARLTAIELIARRRMTACVPALLKVTSDSDAKVRSAAVKRLGELADPKELPAMLGLLMQSTKDLDTAEQAVAAVCGKADNPESCAGQLIALLPQAQPAQKSALLRVLGIIGGADALKAVSAAANDANANAQVRATAIRTLGTWKTADAAPALLALAKSVSNPTDKILCLRSYLGLATRSDLPADQRLAMCRQAQSLIERDEEKRQLLATLGSIHAIESLALIMPYLDAPATQEEANAAAVTVIEKLLYGRDTAKLAPQLIEPLEKLAKITTNANLNNRAKALLQQAKNASGK